ncbi:MAG: hypothetical protein KGL54_14520 [Sphingomonadales bacterium]|nr:hypothetical protein [Sphingomonadales bacterium]
MNGEDWLEGVRRTILRRRSAANRLFLMGAWLAVAVGVRWLLDRGLYGVPFLTFYPVVLLAGLVLGGRYAVMAAVAAVVLARLLFEPGPIRLAPVGVQAAMVVLYAVTIGMIVGAGHLIRLILIENQRHIDLADSFNDELQHRAKNALQILRALIGRGPAAGEDATEFHSKLLGRMEALGRANELLRYGSAGSADVASLVETALAPFGTAGFDCSGPACRLHKSAATPLVMALHELATNATKYGALSCPSGRVSLEWTPVGGGRVALEWRERGGPPVAAPTTRGMGSRLLRPHGGLVAVALEWEPEGATCRMEVIAAG